MASSVKNHEVREPSASAPVPAPKRATTVFIPLVTPFLYGMERAVIELFDALRPEVEPYFLQSSRIFERRPAHHRGDDPERFLDGTRCRIGTDWERLARPILEAPDPDGHGECTQQSGDAEGGPGERRALCAGDQRGLQFTAGGDLSPGDGETSDPPLSPTWAPATRLFPFSCRW